MRHRFGWAVMAVAAAAIMAACATDPADRVSVPGPGPVPAGSATSSPAAPATGPASSASGGTAPGTTPPGTAPGTTATVDTLPAGTGPGAAPVRSFPTVPPAGQDCGSTNMMSGWPTTFPMPPTVYECIVAAAAAGTPARMVVIRPGGGESRRRTGDGYEIPNALVRTYLVLGPRQLQVFDDDREGGGELTVRTCTGLSAPPGMGSEPGPTGCTAG